MLKFKQIEPYRELSVKAARFYCNTNPLSILTNGEAYKLTGAIEGIYNSMEEINALLEALDSEMELCEMIEEGNI